MTTRKLINYAQKLKPPLSEDKLIKTWKICRGDKVMVMSGKDKGKISTVLQVFRPKNKLLVEGLNLVKKHVRSTGEAKGGIFTQEALIHRSRLALIDPSNGKPTKVAIKYLEDGTKVRVSKKTGTIIPKSDIIRERRKPRPTKDGAKDTPLDIARKITYDAEKEEMPFLKE